MHSLVNIMLLSKYLLLYIDLTIAWKLVILIYNLSRDIISSKPVPILIVSASLIIGHLGFLWQAKQYWPSTTNQEPGEIMLRTWEQLGREPGGN